MHKGAIGYPGRMTPCLANRFAPRLAALLLGVALPVAVMAEAPAAETEPVEIGTSGQAYLDALWLRGIDSGVSYYDPARGAPDLETGAEPVKPKTDEDSLVTGWDVTNAVALAVILGIILLFVRFGGGLSVSFSREAENARRGPGAAPAPGADAPASLAAILATPDRREALLRLAGAALARAVAAQGLLFQQSWTGREALARLPEATPHRAALRALVLEAEAVHFGGRDIGEAAFRDHVAAVRPLVEGAAA